MRAPLLLLIALSTLLLATPIASDAASRSAGPLERLMDIELEEGEAYHIVELSERVLYVVFSSGKIRLAVFEGVPQDRLVPYATPLTLSVPRPILAEAYAGAARLAGIAAAFRDEISKTGFLTPPGDGSERVLFTVIQTAEPGADGASFSGFFQAANERREGIDRVQGDTGAELDSIKVVGPGPLARRTEDSFRFDGFQYLLEAAEKREAARERRLAARRAMLASELSRALYHVDPAYGDAVADWIGGELAQADVNLLAQLLQLAGYREMSPRILVEESAPHLFEPSVLTLKLLQGLCRVTVPAKRRGRRQLDPQQFPDKELRERAEAFYGRFFVGDGKRGYRLELRDEIQEFLERGSAAVQRLSAPFVDRHFSAPVDG